MTKDNIVRVVGAIDNIVEKVTVRIPLEKAKNFSDKQILYNVVEEMVLECVIASMFSAKSRLVDEVISYL